MVAAIRQRFQCRFYQPIAVAVNQAALENLPSNASCLDAGCGEGYYLRQLAAASSDGSSLALLGLDILNGRSFPRPNNISNQIGWWRVR